MQSVAATSSSSGGSSGAWAHFEKENKRHGCGVVNLVPVFFVPLEMEKGRGKLGEVK